jgi:hypothetical protein
LIDDFEGLYLLVTAEKNTQNHPQDNVDGFFALQETV